MYRKYVLLIIASVGLLAGCGPDCHENPYYPVDSRLLDLFFKAGTYWVYRDSATGMIDSQYVTNYSYETHIAVSPPSYYNCQNPLYYYDKLRMTIDEYQNHILYRSSLGYFTYYTAHFIITDGFDSIDQAKGLWFVCLSLDTSYYYACGNYFRVLPSLNISGTTFQNVINERINCNSSALHFYPVEYYWVARYGIVRKVEYKTTGTLTWDLIRYNIVR